MRTIEFKTPTGQRAMVLPHAVTGLVEGTTSEAASPVTWIHTTGGSVIVAGAIDTVALALASGSPEAAPAPLTAELEFMRLERARAELKLAKLQGPEVGRRGRRRTGSGEH